MTATTPEGLQADVLVVGGGMAGAIAALAARAAGARVVVARRSPGATALSSGAISVAPHRPAHPDEPLFARRGPLDAARAVAATSPDHPYARLGLDALDDALAFAARELGGLLAPALERPRVLATAFGSAVSAALCQRSMEAGDLLAVRGPLAVAGLAGHLAFDAGLVAAGLARFAARGGPRAHAVAVDLPAVVAPAAKPYDLARALEAPGAAEELGEALRGVLPGGAGAALLPPVLGLDPAARVPERVAAAAGLPVAETLSDVPSVPGLRLQRALDDRLREAGVVIVTAAVAAGWAAPGEAVDAGGTPVRASAWVLATGRFVGGGVARRGTLFEPALRLPVQAAEGREAGVHLAARPAASLTVRDRRAPQPLLSAGLRVDAGLRPLDERGRQVHACLFAAGAVIGGHEQATDGTGLGVAILTGWLAGRAAAAAAR
ncbi:MAG TPA: FAD-binding protein [Anaeromyxobacter sp.]|nr:FAD-binding protein [Anaeromyxobacter sp.]